MTAQPCPVCERVIHQKNCPRRNTRNDPAPDNAQQGETGIPVTEQNQTVNAQQGAREGDERTCPLCLHVGMDFAGDQWAECRKCGLYVCTDHEQQLAAKDAEIARLKPLEGRLMEMVGRAVVGVSLAAQSDVDEYQKIASQYGDLIAALTDALRDCCNVLASNDKTDSATRYKYEIKGRDAIAEAETMMGEKDAR